ncbi:MAG: DUF4157 domain-containing protein [Nostoc sp.]|uniref:eCIS core domain-containing protein n=1 Tax=Nostoc sp. TaxID=1180 RepID=UPI002FF83E6C
MTSKRIAQTNQQQKSEKPQESGILQRAAVRSVADIQSTDDQEELALSNSAFSKDFSQVPISTAKPQQFQVINPQRHPLPPIQAKLSIGEPGDRVIQRKGEMTGDRPDSSVEQRPNKTGMPDALKAGVESLSGYSLDDVRVHYNSPKPAQLQALAYTQKTEIHVASGQEEHLPHEAWHVVQQAQGRVKPTMQMKGKVNVNDDASLEREADVMGTKAMTLRLPKEQRTIEQTTSTLKTLAGSLNVFQLRWIDREGTNQSYWEGRHSPGQRDLDELARRGRVQVDNSYQSIPNAPNANRSHGLFLALSDSDLGEIGAPFPLNEPSSAQQIPQQERHQDVSWLHEGVRVQHLEHRRSERTIHGGVSARQQLQQYGLPDYPRAAWAHIQPDHVTPEDQDREDRAMRHPSTEQANQQHTVREYAQMNVARNMGGMIASRHLHGQQPSRPGLYSSMEFGTTFLTGDETRTHSDEVPFLTQQPGRYGDEDQHARMLNAFGANALASGLRDEGILDENDLPDEFYVRADGDTDISDDEESQSQSTQPMEWRDTEMETRPSENGGGGGIPVIAQAAANLTLDQMNIHYQLGIVWAANQGTFSNEFGQFRANPATAFNVLVQAGLSQNAANTYSNSLTAALAGVSLHYLQQNAPVPDYLPAHMQQVIFDHIDVHYGRSLWALLRYLNAANHQGNGN